MARLTSLFLLLTVLGGCSSKAVVEQSFVRLETPHFEIMSSLDQEDTLELASDLEAFHQTLEFVAGEPLGSAEMKGRVFAFDGRGILRRFGQSGASGYFRPGLDGGTLVLRTAGGWRDDASEDLRHEYAHYLLRNHYGLSLPLWYDEGMAIYASTIDIGDGRAEIGRHRRDHLVRLRSSPWISLSRLLESEHTQDWDDRDRELFDSQAWVLIHSLNAKQRSQLRKQLAAYLAEVEKGTPAKDALTKSFGKTFFGLQKELRSYIRQERLHSLSVKLNNVWRPELASLQPMSEGDVATELGWLSVDLGRPKRALEDFDRATERAGSRPWTDAGIGAAHSQLGDWQAAKPYFERALATGPEDARVQLAVADFYLAQAAASEDAPTRVELAERGLAYAAEARKLAPDSAAPLGTIAELQELAGILPHPDEGPALVAGRKLPSSVEAELLRARHHMALGQPLQARQAARNAHSRSHSKKTQAEAEAILKEINLQVAGS